MKVISQNRVHEFVLVCADSDNVPITSDRTLNYQPLVSVRDRHGPLRRFQPWSYIFFYYYLSCQGSFAFKQRASPTSHWGAFAEMKWYLATVYIGIMQLPSRPSGHATWGSLLLTLITSGASSNHLWGRIFNQCTGSVASQYHEKLGSFSDRHIRRVVSMSDY